MIAHVTLLLSHVFILFPFFNFYSQASFLAPSLVITSKTGSSIYPKSPCLFRSRTLNHSSNNRKINKNNNKIQNAVSAISEDRAHDTNIQPSSPSARYLAIHSLAISERSKTKKSSNNLQNAVTNLESSIYYNNLSTRDKAFARNLVSTTERFMGQIDNVLVQVCDSNYPLKISKHSALVQSCLRVGVAQLLIMDIPSFAAVKETIDALKETSSFVTSNDGKSNRNSSIIVPVGMIKFANAILRRISREGNDLLLKHTSPLDNIAPWLVKEWNECWGEDKTLKIVNQLLDDSAYHHIDLTLNLSAKYKSEKKRNEDIQGIVNEFLNWEKQGRDGKDTVPNTSFISLLPNQSLRIRRYGWNRNISSWPLYEDGKWWVQDVSSTLPAIGLHKGLQSIHDDISKLNVVDMCAAPGGKTSQLLSFGFGHVTAVESNSRRSKRLKENLDRLNLANRCNIVISNGQDWIPQEKVDGVLVDVPCSATGTGSRRPDILTKTNDDIKNLLETQEILANHCADNVIQPGGIMVYATCSLLKRESEDQVMKLISRGNEAEGRAVMQTLPFTKGEIPGFDDAIDNNGWIRVLPGILGGELNSCDGFFLARLIRIK